MRLGVRVPTHLRDAYNGVSQSTESEDAMFEKPFIGTPPDYSDPENWLALPDEVVLPADVIFLYPTACMAPDAPLICELHDPATIQQANDYFAQSGAVFEGVGNIFAPLWRQESGPYVNSLSFDEVDKAQWAEPRTDVFAAMDYYFENLNDGRPWVIAGHSQGSRLLGMVLGEYMGEHLDYYERMICAYRVGDGMTRPYLAKYPHVRPAQGPDDLGVCASWNTEGLGNRGRSSLVIPPECVAINPLNWVVDDTPAGEELCMGCFLPAFPGSELIPLEEKASTVLDLERGTVIVTNPEMAKYSITALAPDPLMAKAMETTFGPECFHNCDYGFFFYNIRENATNRVRKWLEMH